MQLPDAAIGSIIAAAIAGLVVFISTVLTKEQKTSEFRQTWIDELRKDISQYISGASEIVALFAAKRTDKAAQDKFLDDNFKLIHELQGIEHRIILRLNPIEHATLIAQIEAFRENLLDAYAVASASADADADLLRKLKEDRLTQELLNSAKSVLKTEWRRVKKGEPAFRIVKWSALAAAACLAYLLIQSQGNPTKPFETVDRSAPSGERTNQIFIENRLELSHLEAAENAARPNRSGKRLEHRHPRRAKCRLEK